MFAILFYFFMFYFLQLEAVEYYFDKNPPIFYGLLSIWIAYVILCGIMCAVLHRKRGHKTVIGFFIGFFFGGFGLFYAVGLPNRICVRKIVKNKNGEFLEYNITDKNELNEYISKLKNEVTDTENKE